MVNNLKQLRKRYCTSIIQLIKQDALEKNMLLVYYKKKSEFKITRIGMENFC